MLDAPHCESLRLELPCRLFSACHHMWAFRRLHSCSCSPARVESSALRPGCGSEVACLLANQPAMIAMRTMAPSRGPNYP